MVIHMNIKNELNNRILLTDGAMGTYYNQKYPAGCSVDEASILAPERIIGIHEEYINAGADIIRTNTFASNRMNFGTVDEIKRSIKAACGCAKAAVKNTGKDGQVEIFASIGPVRYVGEADEAEVLKEYFLIIDTFLECGITSFAFETFAESKPVRLMAEYLKSKCSDAFTLGMFSFNPTGYTKFGYSMQNLVYTLSSIEELDAFGFNCGLSSAHMAQQLQEISFENECKLAILPNAGYMIENRGRLTYADAPEYFVEKIKPVVGMGVNIIGGCCGTTPEYTKALKEMLLSVNGVSKKNIGKADTVSETASESEFIKKLKNVDEKAFIVELEAPFNANADKILTGAKVLKNSAVDIITVSDSPMARSRAESILVASYLKVNTGIEVMPHITCRDRNIIGLRSALLGAHINDIRDMLIITGDPIGIEDRKTITNVFDMNSIKLMEYIKHMNEEVFTSSPIYYGGALNYSGVNAAAIANRMKRKMEAGCSYFLTQPIYSDEDIERIKWLKNETGAVIACGIMPLVSYKNAMYMKHEMPGINVPDYIIDRYSPEQTREEAENTAIEISVEIARKLYDIADGYYFMTPFNRVSMISKIIDAIKTK